MISQSLACLERDHNAATRRFFTHLFAQFSPPFLDADKPTERERPVIEGPDVPIAEKSVTGLALLLHEVATNAVKSGSMGRVRISSSMANGQFLATWMEEGGPRLNGAPDHEGFGSSLARRIVTGQFGGQLSYDWKPEGLVVRLSIPAERLTILAAQRPANNT